MCEYEMHEATKNKPAKSVTNSANGDEVASLRALLQERDVLISSNARTIAKNCEEIQDLKRQLEDMDDTISKVYISVQ